jgi:hypothetical protein
MMPQLLDDLARDGLPILGVAVGVTKAVGKSKGNTLAPGWWMYILGGWLAGWGASKLVRYITSDFPAVVPTVSLVPSTENEASTPP